MSESKSKSGAQLEGFTKENWPAHRVRQTYIDFFCKQNEHKFVPSSPILPHNDPTLLFANSGMNQFKACFLGQLPEGSPLTGVKRVANSQKCLRAGGKHNDLEEVGYDVYHHTFFEMLGNWSFGDYFKEEAITWSWQLLTEVYGIPGDRLYATYYGGDPTKPGVPPDNEAKEIWLRYLPANRVLPFNAKDNFWEMGATGPCGPCTEIHYDRIGNREVPELVNMDDPNVLEIWNNVFMQFNCDVNGDLKRLEDVHVDTGMGFERLTSVLQGVTSNYDTDIFEGIFAAIQADTGCRAYTGKVGAEDTDGVDMAYRVVADHIRALTFAITDFIDPDADGRGYVLRRILRRGVRYANQFLGAKPGFFSRLSQVVVNEMKGFFPELSGRAQHVAQVLLAEETTFNKTLTRGLKRFNNAISDIKAGEELSAEVACDLYSTYGFPLDLTRVMCDEKKIILNEEACEEALEKQREISRQGGDDDANVISLDALQSSHLRDQKVQPTDDLPKFEWKSIGSGSPLNGCTVKAIVVGLKASVEHKLGFVDQITGAHKFGVILDRTSYYAEQGGQIYDTGVLRGDGFVVNVSDAQKCGPYVLHIGTLESGDSKLAVGATVSCVVDYKRRALIAKNHTATHMLNYGLREVVGETEQRGSLVDSDKLRFDFSFSRGVKVNEIKQIQQVVQSIVDAKTHVDKKECAYAEAKEIQALRAVFGEKYPTRVRVVAVAPENTITQMLASPADAKWMKTSVEFCGGTHLDNAGEIGSFVIVSEEGTQRGVRRIVGLTGPKAVEAIADGKELSVRFEAAEKLNGLELQAQIKSLSAALESSTIPVVLKDNLKKALKKLNKKYLKWKKGNQKKLEKKAMALVASIVQEEAKRPFVVLQVDAGGSSRTLKKAGDALVKGKSVPCLLYSVDTDNNSLAVYCTVPQAASGSLNAKEWALSLLSVCGGKAGGKPTSSSGASRSADNVAEGVQSAMKFATSKLA